MLYQLSYLGLAENVAEAAPIKAASGRCPARLRPVHPRIPEREDRARDKYPQASSIDRGRGNLGRRRASGPGSGCYRKADSRRGAC
jgi:hypothetical protein